MSRRLAGARLTPAAYLAGVLTSVVLVTVALAGCSGPAATDAPAGASRPGQSSAGPSGTGPSGTGPSGTGLAGTGGPAGPGAAVAGATSLDWRRCPSELDGNMYTGILLCARLDVPLNYRQPDGRKITLALSERPATAPARERQGDLLVNPGGPGASGLTLPVQVAEALSPAVAAEYNIVGFDTRGVGSSTPALHCDPGFFSRPRPDYVPSGPAAEQVLKNRARAYAADCEKRFGWLLPYMTTEDLARDLDSIRVALGQRQINYLGYSYGTYLGQVYATLFPTRIRRMVLDSVVDPRGVWYADNLTQDYAFQGRMNAFYDWVAANDSSYHLGRTSRQVAAAWNRAMAKTTARPIPGPHGPLVGPDELTDTFLVGGYDNAVWPDLATALASYLNRGAGGELATVYQAIGRQSENEFAVYNAVDCADVNWPRNWAKWNADNNRIYAAAPFETWGNAWFNAACAFWPVKGPATPVMIRGRGLPPILMLQGTLDAATPYRGALAARAALPTARMVVVEGGGNHGQSLSSPPDPCVLSYLNGYLSNGALPAGSGPVSATCPAMPAPAA
jgi:pimeloyl-ACP methyl ester carboxylesterase